MNRSPAKTWRVTLPDALHARPASLLVRVSREFSAEIVIVHETKRASAKMIMEVLSLHAAKGHAIELSFQGEDADAAMSAITKLIEQNFSADLVPEKGASAVEGIAIGRALVAAASEPNACEGVVDLTRATARFDRVRKDLESDIAALHERERELLEPELAILKELLPRVTKEMESGKSFREAVETQTAYAMTDLFLDARARLLGDVSSVNFAAIDGPAILVAKLLPPSLVAALPAHVMGIVSAADESDTSHGTGNTSHAAILARSRNIPLAYFPEDIVESISAGDSVVLDTITSPARVWIDPSAALLADATSRRDELVKGRAAQALRAKDLARISKAIVRVNVNYADEVMPDDARGVGLVRTELVFASHRVRPSVEEQTASYRAIVARAHGHAVSIRLFDAGFDKPLAWLLSEDASARGIALLFQHEIVLETQLRAIFEARSAGDARALIPLCESADDVRRVRKLAPKDLRIGAMIETKRAAERADEIAAEADFVSLGTNDLTASVLSVSRADSSRGLEPLVWNAILSVIASARRHSREVTVCGELAAHELGGPRLIAAGVHALSVAIPAFSRVVELVSVKPEEGKLA